LPRHRGSARVRGHGAARDVAAAPPQGSDGATPVRRTGQPPGVGDARTRPRDHRNAVGAMNRFKKVVRTLTAENQELEADDLQQQATKGGATTVARCGDRVPVTVLGTIRAMTIRPRAGVPALEAELY